MMNTRRGTALVENAAEAAVFQRRVRAASNAPLWDRCRRRTEESDAPQ